MIEVAINIFQIIVLLIAFSISFREALSTHRREWSVAALFYAVYAMADIYWLLILHFYHRNSLFYISDIGWYSGFLVIDVLIMMFCTDEERSLRSRILWIIPVFTLSMFCFFIYLKGDIPGNIVTLILMTMIMYRCSRGLIYINGGYSEENKDRRMLYTLILIFCFVEYSMWAISCFWMGDTFTNPYFWFDIAQSFLMFMMIPAIRKGLAA